MPRKSKGPRLHLRKPRVTADGKVHEYARWVIRDGKLEIGIGCLAAQRIEAEAALQAYINEKNKGEYVEKKVDAFIYFISAKKEGFPIKIGITNSADVRFKAMQTSLPYDIEILALARVEYASLERVIHGKFSATRLRGEWFERTPSLMSFIEEIKAQNGHLSGGRRGTRVANAKVEAINA